MRKNTYQIYDTRSVRVIRIASGGDNELPAANAYLVDDDVLTLIDTGCLWPDAERLFLQIFNSLGFDITDLKNIIITHGHGDHYGLAKRLTELSGANVYIHKNDIHKVTGTRVKEFNVDFPSMRRFLLGMGMSGREIDDTRNTVNSFSNSIEQLEDVKPVEDGYVFRLGKSCMKVIHCPGHTPGSISIYDVNGGILFTGDYLLPEQISNALIDPVFEKSRIYKSLASQLSSLERVKELSVELAFPGHGSVFDDIHSAIDSALGYFKEFREDVIRLMGDHEIGPTDIARRIDSTLTGLSLYVKMSDVLGMLEILEEDGLVESSAEDGGVVFRRKKF